MRNTGIWIFLLSIVFVSGVVTADNEKTAFPLVPEALEQIAAQGDLGPESSFDQLQALMIGIGASLTRTETRYLVAKIFTNLESDLTSYGIFALQTLLISSVTGSIASPFDQTFLPGDRGEHSKNAAFGYALAVYVQLFTITQQSAKNIVDLFWYVRKYAPTDYLKLLSNHLVDYLAHVPGVVDNERDLLVTTLTFFLGNSAVRPVGKIAENQKPPVKSLLDKFLALQDYALQRNLPEVREEDLITPEMRMLGLDNSEALSCIRAIFAGVASFSIPSAARDLSRPADPGTTFRFAEIINDLRSAIASL
jgi:hypothetical protein